MGIFDPKVDTEVSYQQPLQTPTIPQDSGPSVGMALAETGASILEGVGRAVDFTGRGGSASGRSSSDEFAMANFQNTIMKAEAARAKGDMALAERIESTAVLNATRQGLTINSNLKDTYSALTGRAGDELFFSRDQMLENRIMETPEYESALLATYASNEELTMEQRHEMAIGRVARQQGQAQTLLNDQIAWTEGKRDAFSTAITDFESSALGTLREVGKQRGFVGQDELRRARILWEEEKSGLYRLRPEGVTDDQWSEIEDRITRVDEQFAVLEELSSDQGIEGMIAAEVAGAIQSSDWSPGKKMIGLTILKDAAALGEIRLDEMRTMAESLLSDDFAAPIPGQREDENGDLVDSTIPPVVTESLKGESAEKSFERARGVSRLGQTANADKISSDPAYREDFFKTTTLGFAAMTKIGNDDNRFLTADGINEVFNGEIIEGLRRAGVADPVKARAVSNIAFEALDKQFAIASGQLRATLDGTSLRLDENGQLALNREVLLESMSPEMFDRIERNAQEFYNGNLLAMIEDRGRKVPRREFDPATDDPMTMEPAVVPGAVLYRSIGDIGMIREQLRSVRTINQKRGEFRALRDTFLGDTNDDNFQGSQGSDTLGAGASRILSLMDKREGAGNYDTLFQHSQRQGREFAGVKITNMTLGELSDFSQGAYAQWSKGQLGYVATPMGRYQIVGSTLRQTMKEMGLPRNMLFTPEVQDAMFHHLATKALRGKETPAAKREAMRATWEGFNKVSNSELDKAIAEFEGTAPPSYTELQRAGGTMQEAPRTSIRPEERQSAEFETTDDVNISGGGTAMSGGGGGDMSIAADDMSIENAEAGGGAGEVGQAEQRASEEEQRDSSRAVAEQQRNKARQILSRLGVDANNVPQFDSVDEAQRAINTGDLNVGDVYIVDGQIEVVEEA